jgi:hypothetical protein
MWSFEDIRNAIDLDDSERVKPLLLGLSDFQIPLGIGIGELGAIILIVPGEEFESRAQGIHFSFEPWTTIHPEGFEPISGVGVLVIRYPSISDNEKNALASLFLGIVQMQLELGPSARVSRVVRSLAALFDSRLKVDINKSAIVGLTGELLAIHKSRNSDFLVSTWRSQDKNRYDFSSNRSRLEVKTTTQLFREHAFSSNQLPAQQGINLAILSILYHEVEDGMSFADLFSLVWDQITNADLKSKLLSVCIDTLGSHPSLIEFPKFDALNSLASMTFFAPDQIPQPTSVPGVTYMKWNAVLTDELSFGQEFSDNEIFVAMDSRNS